MLVSCPPQDKWAVRWRGKKACLLTPTAGWALHSVVHCDQGLELHHFTSQGTPDTFSGGRDCLNNHSHRWGKESQNNVCILLWTVPKDKQEGMAGLSALSLCLFHGPLSLKYNSAQRRTKESSCAWLPDLTMEFPSLDTENCFIFAPLNSEVMRSKVSPQSYSRWPWR